MQRRGAGLVILLISMVLGISNAGAQPVAAPESATACSACHGGAGVSQQSTWPSLAGQHERYLREQLLAFQAGEEGPRYDPVMTPLAKSLSIDAINTLAAYYASQPLPKGVADPAQLALGQRLYRGGDLSRHIPACAACHGPAGRGNNAAGFPALSGQQPSYLVQQLKNYQSGRRSTGPKDMMSSIASRLTEAEQQAIASFASGLH